MPHQCLKCGKIFPSGSMEIFKGCSNCKGKRFFYTDKPISDKEREVITERANKDIKELVRDLLTQPRQDVLTDDLTDKSSSGWVKVDKNKNIESIKAGEPVEEKIPLSDIQSRKIAGDKLKDLGSPKEIKSKLQELLDEELTGAGSEKPAAEVVSVIENETVEPLKDKADKAARKKPVKDIKRKELKKAPGEKHPEVITIVEPGVYEIDLEQLMDNSPVIVLKDGTYLLHLPSLFNKPIK